MNEHLRQTGRTTRQLEKALKLRQEGRPVRYLVHDREYVRCVQDRVREILRLQGIVAKPGDVHMVQVVPEEFDWTTMRIPNDHPRMVCIVDHSAVEFSLEELDKRILRMQQTARQMYQLTLGA